MTRRRLSLALGGALFLAAVLGASFVAGVFVTHYKMTPYTWSMEQLKELRKPKDDLGRVWTDIWTVFLPLKSTADPIDVEREGSGGALTAFLDGVVLLTHEGRFFYSSGPGEIVPLAIEAPENGFVDLAADADRLSDTFTFYLDQFRYNDVLAHDGPAGTELFVSFTRYETADQCYRSVVSHSLLPSVDIDRLQEGSADFEWSDIFVSAPCLPLTKGTNALDGLAAGGRMALRDGKLYLGSGDYEWDGMKRPIVAAQRPDYDYGKVIEITLSTGEARQYSTGHRNLQGMAFDKDGDLYAVEHGMLGGDELNLVLEGRNYGWPLESLGTGYNGLQLSSTTTYGLHDTYESPVHAWLPSVAISSLTLIDDFDEAWDGDFLLATLKDVRLHRLRIRDQRMVFDERIYIGERIRYAQVIPGYIVLWTDSRNLIWITVAERSRVGEFVERHLNRIEGSTEFADKVRSAVAQCNTCHSFEPNRHNGAPSLAGVYGKPIGGTTFDAYSDALAGRTGSWTDDNLVSMIIDPAAFAPGTSMPSPGIDDPEIAREIVRLLAELRKVE